MERREKYLKGNKVENLQNSVTVGNEEEEGVYNGFAFGFVKSFKSSFLNFPCENFFINVCIINVFFSFSLY